MKYKLIAKQLPSGVVFAGDGETSCGQGSCPAVLKTTDGKAIVVGRILTQKEHAAITKTGVIAFHAGESAVEVSPELLHQAAGKLYDC